MASRLFLIYLAAELAMVVFLAWTIGLGWTSLLLLGVFAGGLVLVGSQLRAQLNRLRTGVNGGPALAADSLVVATGTLLVVVPGLLTSIAGLLLLAPPTRPGARLLLKAAVVRGLGRRVPLSTVVGRYHREPPDYIDGEVVDVDVVSRPALPRSRSR